MLKQCQVVQSSHNSCVYMRAVLCCAAASCEVAGSVITCSVLNADMGAGAEW